jgi:hypothetical protein
MCRFKTRVAAGIAIVIEHRLSPRRDADDVGHGAVTDVRYCLRLDQTLLVERVHQTDPGPPTGTPWTRSGQVCDHDHTVIRITV